MIKKKCIVPLIFVLMLVMCAPIGKFIIGNAFSDPEGREIIVKEWNTPVELLDSRINSPAGESNPVITPDGNYLYFGRSKGGNFFDYKIHVSQWLGNSWSPPVQLGSPPNMNSQNFIGSFTSDNQLFVFTSHNSGGFNKDNESKIMIARKKGSSYEIVEELDFFKGQKGFGFNPLNGKWNLEGQVLYDSPFISADGTILLFSSNLNSGIGAQDLYMCRKDEKGNWGEPENLGPIVNTPAMESSPFLYADNKTLFFSSNGHPGLGKMDIYRTVLENGQWSKPEPLGAPINSEAVDYYFSVSAVGGYAYFVSDRDKEHDFNIYQTAVKENILPEKVVLLSGIIRNSKDESPLNAEICIEDLDKQEKVAQLYSDTENGSYSVSLIKGRSYSISAEKDSFTFYSMDFFISEENPGDTLKRDIYLMPIEKGAALVLNNLFFDSGSSKIKPESMLELKRLSRLLKENPQFQIEISGHTDNVGSRSSNDKLSKDRAESVRVFLMKEGINQSRLSAKGYGFSKPVASNDTDEGRKQNRRVEILFTE